MINEKWASRFLDLAFLVASWSHDPSSKVGACIAKNKRIISMGFNGFPARTADDEKLYNDRERKYLRVVHAEKNAILFAKQDLSGCQLYATHFPCCQCTAFIIQSGITEVIVPEQNREYLERWFDPIRESLLMMEEAQIVPLVFLREKKQIRRFHLFNSQNLEDY